MFLFYFEKDSGKTGNCLVCVLARALIFALFNHANVIPLAAHSHLLQFVGHRWQQMLFLGKETPQM